MVFSISSLTFAIMLLVLMARRLNSSLPLIGITTVKSPSDASSRLPVMLFIDDLIFLDKNVPISAAIIIANITAITVIIPISLALDTISLFGTSVHIIKLSSVLEYTNNCCLPSYLTYMLPLSSLPSAICL